MADKKRDILEFVEESNFEQFTPTQNTYMKPKLFNGFQNFPNNISPYGLLFNKLYTKSIKSAN